MQSDMIGILATSPVRQSTLVTETSRLVPLTDKEMAGIQGVLAVLAVVDERCDHDGKGQRSPHIWCATRM